MDRKEIIIKNLKRITALLVFAAPCAVYLILIRRRAGDALLYTAPFQWWITALALAAGLFSYIILRREKPADENTYEDESCTEDDSYDSPAQKDEIPSAPVVSELDLAEYPELFSEKDPAVKEDTHDMSAGISAAISMQKAPTVTTVGESDADRAWEEFSGDVKEDDFTYPEELYDNIPDLPEDYEIRSSDEDEKEYSLNYTVRRPHIGETVLSKLLCVFIAAVLSLGAAFAASFSYCTESETGFSAGGREYLYKDVKSYTVSQKLLGSLSVEVLTEDGRKTELFPATIFKGEKFSEKYDSIYAYMAHAVRLMQNSGAAKTVENREDIITSFRDAEDGSAQYIEEIIGEKLK